jgi:hypothetical protein
MNEEQRMWEWLIKVGQVPAGSKPPAAASPEKEEK